MVVHHEWSQQVSFNPPSAQVNCTATRRVLVPVIWDRDRRRKNDKQIAFKRGGQRMMVTMMMMMMMMSYDDDDDDDDTCRHLLYIPTLPNLTLPSSSHMLRTHLR